MHHRNLESYKHYGIVRWNKRKGVQRYWRLVERLFRMRPAEMAFRLKLFSKHVARLLGKKGSSARISDVETEKAIHDIALIRESLSRNFFFGPSDRETLTKAIMTMAGQSGSEKLADQITSAGINVLGVNVRLKGGEIDWQADPKTGLRFWPTGYLTEADAIKQGEADVKYVWEVNRHQFLPTLGRAFWLTGKVSYAHYAANLIDDWITQNPVGLGVNWCSHLEVAMRSISWLWSTPFLLSCTSLEHAFFQRFVETLAAHYRHLTKNLSIFTDPTNHLIGEAAALWLLSVSLPFPDAINQRRRAKRILLQQLERQVTQDGVNREQASSYHRFVLDFYLQFLVLSNRLGEELPKASVQRIETMLEYVASLAGSSGNAPMIGDSDDARGIPFIELIGWDFRDQLSTGAILFERGEWKHLAGPLPACSVWLLGAEAGEAYGALEDTSDVALSPKVFSEGGYCFLGPVVGDAQLIFDAGPLGLWPNAAHGHADALSILVRINGRFILVDPGTGTYFADSKIRNALRSTSAHNTLTVDGLDQADVLDTFKWINPMTVSLRDNLITPEFQIAKAEHDGYQRLREPVTHIRTVLSVRTYGWVIVDELLGTGTHLVTRHFNFAPDTELRDLNTHSVVAIDALTQRGVRLLAPDFSPENKNPLVIADKGVWSEQYGSWRPAPRMDVSTETKLPRTFVTIIQPLGQKTVENVSAPDWQLWSHGEGITYSETYACDDEKFTRRIVVNPHNLELEFAKGLQTNASLAFLEQRQNLDVSQVFFAGKKRYLHVLGREFVCSENQKYFSYVS